VQNDIKTLGTNTITITNSGFSSAASGDQSQSSTITVADIDALTGQQAPDIKSASPVVSTSDYVSRGDLEETATITGSDSAYLSAEDDTLSGGRNLTTADVSDHAKVAVISSALAGEIFTIGTNPVGQNIKIGTTYFDVVGVSQTKGSATTANEYDVLVPYTTSEDQLTGYTSTFTTVVIQARSVSQVDLAEDEAATILATANKTTVADLPFTLVNESSLLSAAKSTDSTFAVLLAAVAAVAARRWHRDHEHHARHRDRTHPRNRHPQSHRSAQSGGARTVPLRSRPASRHRRPRRPRRHRRRADRQPLHHRRSQTSRQFDVHHRRTGRLHAHRDLLRLVPGQPGRVPAPYRRPPLRVTRTNHP
jgi:hypothetical protein